MTSFTGQGRQVLLTDAKKHWKMGLVNAKKLTRKDIFRCSWMTEKVTRGYIANYQDKQCIVVFNEYTAHSEL